MLASFKENARKHAKINAMSIENIHFKICLFGILCITHGDHTHIITRALTSRGATSSQYSRRFCVMSFSAGVDGLASTTECLDIDNRRARPRAQSLHTGEITEKKQKKAENTKRSAKMDGKPPYPARRPTVPDTHE